MITHERARELAGELAVTPPTINCHIEDEMRNYITQQEKLHNLYRNLSMETDVVEREKYWAQINEIEGRD